MKTHWLILSSLFLIIRTAVSSTEVPATDSFQRPSIIGIDHIPVAVADLDAASERYRALGFTLKPGRLHDDGIRNNHVKFPDGSGIELISPPANSSDELTADYIAKLAEGDGPAFLFFHARDTDKLMASLRAASIRFKKDDFITLADPRLNFVLFDQDNRSPTDRPEHFAHANSAVAMTSVWLALDGPTRQSLAKTLHALGAVMDRKTVRVPSATKADVWSVQNGSIVLLPKSRGSRADRPIVGVAFEVQDSAAAARYLGSIPALLSAETRGIGDKQFFVPPASANGLWLEFHRK